MERGLNFAANLLAARVGGASVFGAYVVAPTTANHVASYAGAGIGATANRFSGMYPSTAPGYRRFIRALVVVSLGSAALATLILLAGAGPLAISLLLHGSLPGLLKIVAVSAA